LHERLELAEQDKRNAVELAQTKGASELQKAAAAKDAEIQELKAKLDAGDVAWKLAVTEALSAVEKERDALANELVQAKRDTQAASTLAEARLVNELQMAAATKDAEIQGLKATLDSIDVAQKLAITEAVSAVEKERDELKSGLGRAELEKQLAEKSLKDKYETQIKDRDDAIERLRDMKARLSTKMIGETFRGLAFMVERGQRAVSVRIADRYEPSRDAQIRICTALVENTGIDNVNNDRLSGAVQSRVRHVL
jgi:hypothetical protein